MGFPYLRNPDLSGPVLRDTARLSQRYPPIARYGVLGVSTWPIGCDTPSPFPGRFPIGEHAKWRCDTPLQKGYLSDTCAIPYENKANGCDTPLCDTISKGCCAIWGGVSHWAAKVPVWVFPTFGTLTLQSLLFFRFPCFFRFAVVLAFLLRFPFSSKDLKGSAERNILAFFGASLLL